MAGESFMSCEIFSSSVMRDSRSSTRRSKAAEGSLYRVCPKQTDANTRLMRLVLISHNLDVVKSGRLAAVRRSFHADFISRPQHDSRNRTQSGRRAVDRTSGHAIVSRPLG